MLKNLLFMVLLAFALPMAAAQEGEAEATLDAEVTVEFMVNGEWVDVDTASDAMFSEATQVKVSTSESEEDAYTFDIASSSHTLAGITLDVGSDEDADGESPSLASIAARLAAAERQGLDVTALSDADSGVVTYFAISGPAEVAARGDVEVDGDAEVDVDAEIDGEVDADGEEAETEADVDAEAEAGANVDVNDDGSKTVETPSGVTVDIPAEPGAEGENGDEVDGEANGDAEAGAKVEVDDEGNKTVTTPSGVTVNVPANPGANGEADADADADAEGETDAGTEGTDEPEDEEQDGEEPTEEEEDDEDEDDEGVEAGASVDVNVGGEADVDLGGDEDED